jgi:hypothetical protein
MGGPRAARAVFGVRFRRLHDSNSVHLALDIVALEEETP